MLQPTNLAASDAQPLLNKRLLPSAIYLCVWLMAGVGSQCVLADTQTLAAGQAAPDGRVQTDSLAKTENLVKTNSTLETVLVVGQSSTADTDMKQEAARFLSVAGAANDPLQAIYALPGVTFSASSGPGGTEPVIRGSAPQDNAYFIDLIPASYIFHLFGNSIFDKHIIHDFALYPAAFSSQYGNATGGVIDVALRAPRNQTFTTTLHTSLLTAGMLVESGIGENQAFYATYRRSTMDLLLDESDINDDDDEGFQIDKLPISDDYQFKYAWQINDNNSLSLVAAGANDSLAATFDETSQEALKDPDFAGPASLTQGFDSQGLVWNWRGTGRELTSIFSHIRDSGSLVYGKDQYEKTDADRYLSRFFYKQALGTQHILAMGLSVENIQYDIDFNAKWVACNDLDPECSTVDAEYITYKDTLDILSHEVYVEDKWQISDRHALTLGAHYGSNDYIGDGRLEPRIRFDYQINDSLATYTSAGRYSQLPQLREMIEVLGNPNLVNIESDHYVWGISQALDNEWQFSADLYYKDMTNIVISAEQDSLAENYSNGAEGSAYGVEFLVKKGLTDRWYGWASLSLSESDRTRRATGETVRFNYDKPVLFNLVANRMLGDAWMIGFRWNYQSGGRYTPIVDLSPSSSHPGIFEPVYGELNSQRYPDYHRLDFRAEYTSPKPWGYWKFYADILNVYNYRSATDYDYAPNGKELISPPPGFGQVVRRPLLEAAASISHRSLHARLQTEAVPAEILPLVDSFNRALARLEDGYKQQQHFLATAAHELKTPLALIRAQIELGIDEDNRALLLQDISRMGRQVQQLLHLAEASEPQNYHFASVDVEALAFEVTHYLERLANQQGINLRVAIASRLRLANCDSGALFTLLKNLLENAIQHSPHGGLVTLRAEPGFIAVQDEGTGIMLEDIPNLFVRFWRSADRRDLGAGLGLSICWEIATAHGWQLEAKPTDKGVIFSVRTR